ncbi:MAG: hypothetical protein GY778_10825, partial [bacterium]|nr:hypothetical protein [bacterium]
AVHETPAGLLVVGGPGPNIYRRDLQVAFILDLGGNDTYACPVAVADSLTPVSWCLDLSGDDLYLDPGSPTQAAALGGTAVLVDVAGNDSYRCADIGQASALLGTAVLADLAGDDVYLGKQMVQAFATGGDACLLDRDGDDTYRATRFAQASSQILGVAVLADQQGDDLYLTGG